MNRHFVTADSIVLAQSKQANQTHIQSKQSNHTHTTIAESAPTTPTRSTETQKIAPQKQRLTGEEWQQKLYKAVGKKLRLTGEGWMLALYADMMSEKSERERSASSMLSRQRTNRSTVSTEPAMSTSCTEPLNEDHNGEHTALPVFSIEQIRNHTKYTHVVFANPTKREYHLSTSDFQTVFKMDRETFYLQAKWKQTASKKKANMF